MKWTDKQGKKVGAKEFMQRWKRGIIDITPYQQAKMTFNNTWIILVGIICGFVFTFFNMQQLWWLAIILGGAGFNTIVVQLGNYQKMKQLEIFDKAVKEVEHGKTN